jgi:hypothetical protein
VRPVSPRVCLVCAALLAPAGCAQILGIDDPPPVNVLQDPGFELQPSGKPAAPWVAYSLDRCDGSSDPDMYLSWAVEMNGHAHSGQNDVLITAMGSDCYFGGLAQQVDVAPNTRYRLTAHLDSQGSLTDQPADLGAVQGGLDGGGFENRDAGLGTQPYLGSTGYQEVAAIIATGDTSVICVYAGARGITGGSPVSMRIDDVALTPLSP